MKRVLWCQYCNRVYFNKNRCLCKYCDENLVEIDRPIHEDIITMNQKGYVTENCCAGHWNDDSRTIDQFYVAFTVDYDVVPYLLANKPVGLHFEHDFACNANSTRWYTMGLYPDCSVDDLEMVCKYDKDNNLPEDEYFSKESYNKYYKKKNKLLRKSFHLWVESLPDLINN